MQTASCLVAGCVVPIEQAWQFFLLAMVIGVAFGFAFTGIAGRILDFVERRIERRERIEAARHRDHSKVPPMEWTDPA